MPVSACDERSGSSVDVFLENAAISKTSMGFPTRRGPNPPTPPSPLSAELSPFPGVSFNN